MTEYVVALRRKAQGSLTEAFAAAGLDKLVKDVPEGRRAVLVELEVPEALKLRLQPNLIVERKIEHKPC